MGLRNRFLLLSLLLGAVLFSECTVEKKQSLPILIDINCSDAKEFPFSEENSAVFNLGMQDNITDVLFYKDLCLFRSRDLVSAISTITGSLVYRCSNRGRKEDEFISIKDAWIRGETLYIFDFNSTKILRFDVRTGEYQGNTIVETPEVFSLLRWDAVNDRYVGVRTFTQSPVPDLAAYDSSFFFKYYLDAPIKKSGIMVSSPLAVSESGDILYHRPFESTVFKIVDSSLIPKYQIDFGENQIPDSYIEGQDLYEVVTYWNDNQDHLAAFIMDFAESDTSFYFSYRYSGHVFFVSFNTTNGSTHVYRFDDSDMIYYHDEHVYVFSQSEECTMMYKIPAALL